LEENAMETTPELPPGRGNSDNAEQADHLPSDSVASLLPGQQPGAVSDCGGGHGVAHQLTNVAAIVIPLAACVLAAVMLWGRFVEWIDLAVLGVAYVATCLGITVGFHRLLTHRSFQTYPAVRYALAVLGTLAVEGSVIKWVADHRKHHVFTDQEGDPHSPHEAGPGVSGALSGLWHAHIGWLFNSVGQADQRRYAADLLKDPGLRRIDGAEKPLILASLAIPFLLGLLVKGTLHRRAHDSRVGWNGAGLLVASRDFQHQLDLPLLRPSTLRDQGPLHQRGLAVPRDPRRVLA
jgi:hypothetical protein